MKTENANTHTLAFRPLRYLPFCDVKPLVRGVGVRFCASSPAPEKTVFTCVLHDTSSSHVILIDFGTPCRTDSSVLVVRIYNSKSTSLPPAGVERNCILKD